MKAWTLDAPAGTDSLILREVDPQQPGPHEVRLRVLFAALNPADYYLAQGQYPAKPAYPHILGRDGVGTVQALGDRVTGISVGDTRLILRGETGVSRWGTLAEQVVVPAAELLHIPATWSIEQAGAGTLTYLTAWQAIDQWGTDVSSYDVMLITGASGGVGIAAIQLGRAMGLDVVALSRDEKKWPALQAQGASLCLSPSDSEWRNKLYARYGKRCVSLVVDNVAGPAFPDLIDTLELEGRVSVIGALAGPVPAFNTATLFFRRIRIGGVSVNKYGTENACAEFDAFFPDEAHRAWTQLTATLREAGKKPLIDSIHPFTEVPQAFARLKSGVLGKVLVKVG